MKFHSDNITDLQTHLAERRIEGRWTTAGTNQHRFTSLDGGVLDYWSSTRTVRFQGPQEAAQELSRAFAIGM